MALLCRRTTSENLGKVALDNHYPLINFAVVCVCVCVLPAVDVFFLCVRYTNIYHEVHLGREKNNLKIGDIDFFFRIRLHLTHGPNLIQF